MTKLLISAAVIAATTFAANAQSVNDDSLSGTVKNSIGAVLTATGTTSTAELGVNGFGGGSTVVANSGFNLRIAPVAVAASNGIEAGSFTYGVIDVVNDRSVAVEGVMAGIGQVAGNGSTTTMFSGQMITSADGDNESTVNGNEIVSKFGVTGLASLEGEATSEAGFMLKGTSANWMGETGTVVGGGFDAEAGFLQFGNTYMYGDEGQEQLYYAMGEALGFPYYEGYYLPSQTSFISLVTENSDIDLQIVNMAGGTTLLTGTNTDLFSGNALSGLDSSITLTGESVCSLLGDDYDNVCGIN